MKRRQRILLYSHHATMCDSYYSPPNHHQHHPPRLSATTQSKHSPSMISSHLRLPSYKYTFFQVPKMTSSTALHLIPIIDQLTAFKPETIHPFSNQIKGFRLFFTYTVMSFFGSYKHCKPSSLSTISEREERPSSNGSSSSGSSFAGPRRECQAMSWSDLERRADEGELALKAGSRHESQHEDFRSMGGTCGKGGMH